MIAKTFPCPNCGNPVLAKADYLARGLRCPDCNTGFIPKQKKKLSSSAQKTTAVCILVGAVFFAASIFWGSLIIFVVLIAVGVLVYFVPTMVAHGKRNETAIFMLNLFLGWTFLGWVVALVWACVKEEKS